jgi:hypothetical protein
MMTEADFGLNNRDIVSKQGVSSVPVVTFSTCLDDGSAALPIGTGLRP